MIGDITTECILDTVSLRVMGFATPDGIALMLRTLGAPAARFPPEVYNQDEALQLDDVYLSELARGLRRITREAASAPAEQARRYTALLQNAQQISQHIGRGALIIAPLTLEELRLANTYYDMHTLGRGEAACLALAHRYQSGVVFVSSDIPACRVAAELGVPYTTLNDIALSWVMQEHPTAAELNALINGMRAAKFGLKQAFVDELHALVQS